MIPSGLALRALQPENEIGTDPEAIIVVLFMAGDGPALAEFLTRQWRPLTPPARFLGIELSDMIWHVNLLSLQRIVTGSALAHRLPPDKVVLLGLGGAGAFAIELAMHGVVTARGVIAYDIPLWETHAPIRRSAAAIRLVQHRNATDPDHARLQTLVGEMRRQAIDVQAAILPADTHPTSDMAMRAGARFLSDLLADTNGRTR